MSLSRGTSSLIPRAAPQHLGTARTDGAGSWELHPDVAWVEGPRASARLVHMGGSVYVLRPHASRLLRMLLTRTPGSDEAAVEDPGGGTSASELQRRLVDAQVIRRAGSALAWRERARSALARRLLGSALAAGNMGCDSPSDGAWRLLHAARWGIAVFGWAETVRAWEERYPQPFSEIDGPEQLLASIDGDVRRTAAHSFMSPRCKERALACLALARRNGARADLVVGLADFPIAAHVWVECGETILSDDPESCRAFRPFARYGGEGLRPGP